jgi:RNA polymerase sigma-70 factor (ECF subfamily)
VNQSKEKKNRSQKKSEHEETELILRVKKGDHNAFDALYCLYKNKLYNFLLCKTGSNEDAKDILQEVFMKIWQERKNINEQKNFYSYILKIAQNCMIDKYRRFSKEEIYSPDINIVVEEENPENILLKKERHSILQEAIDQLSFQQKKIHKLHYEQKEALKDIAKEMNISLSAVQNSINKILKNIRKYFAEKKYL